MTSSGGRCISLPSTATRASRMASPRFLLRRSGCRQRLAASTSPWKIVYFHHSPYSSGYHGPVDWMSWPFAEWGASVVLSGHDHTYERLLVDGLPYIVNGLGGGPIYYFINIEPESQVRYNDDYGAMLVTADEATLGFQLFTRRGELVDQYQLGR